MSLATLRAPVAALVALVLLCWPAPASGQASPTLGVDRDHGLSYAPDGSEAAAQQETLLDLTATVNRLIRRFDHGDFSQVADALRDLRNVSQAAAKTPITFRVGMFFEDVTLNMLGLFSEYWAGYRAGTACDMTLVQNLENELKVLEGSGRGNGAVFGRGAVAAVKRRCSA